MLRTVHLHGELGEKYGKEFSLAVDTPGEAVRALITQLSGLEQDIRKGEFICVRGSVDEGLQCEEPHLYLTFGKVTDFHIMPATGGHGRGGGKILLGIALIAATVFTAGAALGAIGVSLGTAVSAVGVGGTAAFAFGGATIAGMSLGMMALVGGSLLIAAGAAQALTPVPEAGDYGDRNEVDQRPGYLFNGAVNTAEQGGPCPLVFGRILAGSVVVSAGIATERIPVNVPSSDPWDEPGYDPQLISFIPILTGGFVPDFPDEETTDI